MYGLSSHALAYELHVFQRQVMKSVDLVVSLSKAAYRILVSAGQFSHVVDPGRLGRLVFFVAAEFPACGSINETLLASSSQ